MKHAWNSWSYQQSCLVHNISSCSILCSDLRLQQAILSQTNTIYKYARYNLIFGNCRGKFAELTGQVYRPLGHVMVIASGNPKASSRVEIEGKSVQSDIVPTCNMRHCSKLQCPECFCCSCAIAWKYALAVFITCTYIQQAIIYHVSLCYSPPPSPGK